MDDSLQFIIKVIFEMSCIFPFCNCGLENERKAAYNCSLTAKQELCHVPFDLFRLIKKERE